MDAFCSVNPTTGETLSRHPLLKPEAVEAAVGRAHGAFLGWRRAGLAARAKVMTEAARLLEVRADEFARLMAEEMGKPVSDGRAEVAKCASVARYYAEHAERFLASEVVATEASRSYVAPVPLGVVLAVMPWNFPFWQVMRFAAPALMAGNAGLLKHAPNVPGCALALEALFRDAGAPEGLFQNLFISTDQVSDLLADPRVRAATLTGSTRAGRALARRAGELLKKTVLELGGSDPYLVLEDADLEAAARTCAASRMINGGQSCIAAKRIIVVDPVSEEFEELFRDAMAAYPPGDPLDEATRLGPLARADLRENLHRQVATSVAGGARLLIGGEVPAGEGFFYPPTVLADVRPGMPAFDEEVFGPAAALVTAEDEAEAIRLANASPFGLGAAVFTRDPARGERIARYELDAGGCFVNSFVKSDPRLPFGGTKDSGYGRELSHHGILEFVNLKTVYVG